MLLFMLAGGEGLNLVGGNHIFMLDLHWNPAVELQATDRAHRVDRLVMSMSTGNLTQAPQALELHSSWLLSVCVCRFV